MWRRGGRRTRKENRRRISRRDRQVAGVPAQAAERVEPQQVAGQDGQRAFHSGRPAAHSMWLKRARTGAIACATPVCFHGSPDRLCNPLLPHALRNESDKLLYQPMNPTSRRALDKPPQHKLPQPLFPEVDCILPQLGQLCRALCLASLARLGLLAGARRCFAVFLFAAQDAVPAPAVDLCVRQSRNSGQLQARHRV